VNISLEKLEGKRRIDEEAKLRRQDAKKQRTREEHDLPSQLMQINKLNDPDQLRKRSKLILPAPQVSEKELEEIAKMGYQAGEVPVQDGSAATKALLSDYKPTAAATPMRTPRTPAGGDTILMEAQNLVALTTAATPLKGGENTPLHPSSFDGVTPSRKQIQTPNVLATPFRTPAPPGTKMLPPPAAATPAASTPARTPLRDELRINDDSASMDESVMAEKHRQAAMKKQVLAGLSSLPAPSHDYSIAVPPLPPAHDENQHAESEEDASDRLARETAQREAAEAALVKQRSKVIQRDLPRPFTINTSVLKDASVFDSLPALQRAEEMLKREMLSLLQYDALKFPLKAGPPPKKPPQLEAFTQQELHTANELLEQEMGVVEHALGHGPIGSNGVFEKAWEECNQELAYLPSQKKYSRVSTATKQEKLDALRDQFESLRMHMEKESKRAMKLEHKLNVVFAGYQTRATQTTASIAELYQKLDEARRDLQCFRGLQIQETHAIPLRIQRVQEEVSKQMEREKELQARYAHLLAEKDTLETLLMRAPS